MIAPSTAENLSSGRWLGPRLSGASNQAENKGPLGASFKGPYASKYNWKKAPTVGPIKKMKDVVPLKRKNTPYPPPAPLKKLIGKGKVKEAAAVSLNPDGFYDVKISYDHISSLAAGCGFTIKEVEEAIHTDNAQRQIQAAKEVAAPEITEPITEKLQEDDLDLGHFDPDSEDELTSDEGAY